MKSANKIWIAIALLLITVGGVLFVSVLWSNDWQFSETSPSKYENTVKEINEDFDSISVISETARISFVQSENGKAYISLRQRVSCRYSASVNDGRLVVDFNDETKWYERIFNFGREEITVHLPKCEYEDLTVNSSTSDVYISSGFTFESVDISLSTGDVKASSSKIGNTKISVTTGDIYLDAINVSATELSLSTGDVKIKDVTCEGDINITVSTGDIYFENVNCSSLVTEGNTGDVKLLNVIAENKFDITRSTGEINMTGCDAGDICIETSTGDVIGSLLTEKIFIVNTSTGEKRVPETLTGGKCKITTSTGDIIITLE